jgi:predicted  nucleic acid-binding Zn-ribbon protein
LRKELNAVREENALAAARNAKERADGQKELSSVREECERLRVATSKLSMEKRSLEEQVAGL